MLKIYYPLLGLTSCDIYHFCLLFLPSSLYVYVHLYTHQFKNTFVTFLLLNHLKIACRYWDISSLNTSTYLPRRNIFYYSAIGFHFFVQEPMKVYAQGYISLISFNLYYSYWLFSFRIFNYFLRAPASFLVESLTFKNFLIVSHNWTWMKCFGKNTWSVCVHYGLLTATDDAKFDLLIKVVSFGSINGYFLLFN